MAMSNTVRVSYEFFPPNDDEMAAHLWAAVQRLAPLQPEFVSVTYGADGSTRSRTHACVLRMLRQTGLIVAPHCLAAAIGRTPAASRTPPIWSEGSGMPPRSRFRWPPIRKDIRNPGASRRMWRI